MLLCDSFDACDVSCYICYKYDLVELRDDFLIIIDLHHYPTFNTRIKVT